MKPLSMDGNGDVQRYHVKYSHGVRQRNNSLFLVPDFSTKSIERSVDSRKGRYKLKGYNSDDSCFLPPPLSARRSEQFIIIVHELEQRPRVENTQRSACVRTWSLRFPSYFLSLFSRKGPFLFPQTSPSSLPRSRGTGHRIFPWQSAMTVGVICIRRCMFHQFTLGKHANRGDRSIYIRIPFLVETQAGAECKRRQQLILGVRRYGNRKERLKEETKGEGEGRFGVNTKRASGIPK